MTGVQTCALPISAPGMVLRYFRPHGSSACAFSLDITNQVLKFRTKARIRVMPPEHRTTHGQYVGICHAAARARGKLRFWCRSSLDPFDASSEVSLHSSLLFLLDMIGLSRLFNRRVGPGNFAPASHRSGREPLDSSGSCHPKEDCRLPPRQRAPPVSR